MSLKIFSNRATTICLLVGLILPTIQPAAFAATPGQTGSKMGDVGLNAAGNLTGQVLDQRGQPVANSPVVISMKGDSPLQTQSNERGEFAFKDVPAGVYFASTPGAEQMMRVWAARTAPPAAAKGILLVQSEATARAQLGNHRHFHHSHEFLRNHWKKIAIGLGIAGAIWAIADHDDAS